jgi:hypothetical protein
MVTILIIAVLVMMLARSGDRWHRQGRSRLDIHVAELERRFEEQQVYVQTLEGRVAQLEEGLDFAERMLAERSIDSTT